MTGFFDLTGQAAVVTGGTSGIGLATAKRLGEAGASVAIAGRRPAEDAAAAIGAIALRCDVSDEDQVQSLMRGARDAFGRLDIVVNCAGVNAGYAELTTSEKRDFDFNYGINTLGVAYGIKHGAAQMEDNGRIINVVSVAGLQGVAYLAPYVASKWAAIGVTRTAAIELGARGIRVNAVCPTSVNTPMAHAEGGESQLAMERKAVPLGRIAEPEEIAALIHFLASRDCDFINGQAIAADGGFTAGLSRDAFDTLASS